MAGASVVGGSVVGGSVPVEGLPRPRGTAQGAPTTILQRAWRASAETGAPSLALAAGADGQPEVIWVNRALTALVGIDPDEVIGQALGSLAAADPGSDLNWARVSQELLHGKGGQREGAVRRIDGSEVRVQLNAVPVTAHDARPGDAWLITVHPLTDSAQDAEAALREAEHRFMALAESAPVGIFLSEAGVRLGYVNDRFVEIIGADPFRLLGTGWLTIVLAEDLPLVYSAAESVLDGRPAECTVRLTGGDGDALRWVNLRLAPTMTPARAVGFIGTAEDVTERRAWEERITYQAHHDPLTGLVNRRRLIEVLHERLGSKRGMDRHMAVVFLDLDGFKEVNDTYGHEAGDRVLIEVARRLQRTARDADLIARVAGDEFVVVLGNIGSAEDAEAASRRHLASLAAPYRVGSLEVHLSASIGIAIPASSDTPESILRAADHVMYQAKAAGSGQYRLAPRARPSGDTGEASETGQGEAP